MKRVAYLTGRTYRGAAIAPGDTPALERWSRDAVIAAGAQIGLHFEVRYWDDMTLAHAGFDAAIIRSCWDYSQRLPEFLAALEAHERGGLSVFNRPSVVRWNATKTYLEQLGGHAVETIWIERADPRAIAGAFDALDAAEIVLKPQVGAGSMNTVRLKRNAWSEADLIDAPRGPAMVQPFLSGIETEGERSLFWFGGVFAYAIQKIPNPGAWLANIPDRTIVRADAPPAAAMAVAELALGCAPKDLLYARVDLVLGDDGRWRVMELEAIEPHLFLDFAPEGAGAFARAVANALAG